jgi:hypothetical protein
VDAGSFNTEAQTFVSGLEIGALVRQPIALKNLNHFRVDGHILAE